MKSEILTKEKNLTKVRMEFSNEEFDNAIERAYMKTRARYNVDGFRKGKAPRKIIEMRYGEGVFLEDAINGLFSAEYPKMLDELDIKAIDRPQIDFEEFEKGKPFVVTASISVEPEVTVENYKGVKVKKISYPVTEKDVQKELETLQKRNGRMVVVERPAKEGDTVLIDYTGYKDDVPFEGGTAQKQPLTLGSGSFIPGFEEQLAGAKAGDDVEVKVTFPKDYHSEELSGKDAVFKVKVHEVKELELPTLDDEFAKDVSEFDTLDEYKADLKAKLKKDAQSKADYEQRNAMLDVIYNQTDVDIPVVMINDQVENMLDELTQQLRYQGMSMDMYLEYMNKDLNSLKEGLRPDAERKVKTRLILEAIAKAEDIKVTEDEKEKELAEMAKMYNMDAEKVKSSFGSENYSYLEQDIRLRKAVDLIADNAVFTKATKEKTEKSDKSDKPEKADKEKTVKAQKAPKTEKEKPAKAEKAAKPEKTAKAENEKAK